MPTLKGLKKLSRNEALEELLKLREKAAAKKKSFWDRQNEDFNDTAEWTDFACANPKPWLEEEMK